MKHARMIFGCLGRFNNYKRSIGLGCFFSWRKKATVCDLRLPVCLCGLFFWEDTEAKPSRNRKSRKPSKLYKASTRMGGDGYWKEGSWQVCLIHSMCVMFVCIVVCRHVFLCMVDRICEPLLLFANSLLAKSRSPQSSRVAVKDG